VFDKIYKSTHSYDNPRNDDPTHQANLDVSTPKSIPHNLKATLNISQSKIYLRARIKLQGIFYTRSETQPWAIQSCPIFIWTDESYGNASHCATVIDRVRWHYALAIQRHMLNPIRYQKWFSYSQFTRYALWLAPITFIYAAMLPRCVSERCRICLVVWCGPLGSLAWLMFSVAFRLWGIDLGVDTSRLAWWVVIIAWIVVRMSALINLIKHCFDLLKDGWRLGVTEAIAEALQPWGTCWNVSVYNTD